MALDKNTLLWHCTTVISTNKMENLCFCKLGETHSALKSVKFGLYILKDT